MRIRIKASPVGPISLVPELPDASLAVMEGLNGIGKTLSVRLLQLCTGTQPYSTQSPAWTSLCRSLGTFEVLVTWPQDNIELHWTGDSRDWIDLDAEPLDERNFRSLQLGGRPATMSEVRRLLTVDRLSGDEGTVETFARVLEAEADLVRQWARRYIDQVSGPLATLERAADASGNLLGRWTPTEYESLTKRSDDARSAAEEQSRHLATSQREWTALMDLRE